MFGMQWDTQTCSRARCAYVGNLCRPLPRCSVLRLCSNAAWLLVFPAGRLTRRSPSPIHLDTRLEAEMEKKTAEMLVAMALPSIVLPAGLTGQAGAACEAGGWGHGGALPSFVLPAMQTDGQWSQLHQEGPHGQAGAAREAGPLRCQAGRSTSRMESNPHTPEPSFRFMPPSEGAHLCRAGQT